MALINLLEYITAIDPAHRTDEAYDCTADAQSILDAGDSLYIPRRDDGTLTPANIRYVISGLAPPSNSVIVCESPLVEIKAASRTSWIMEVNSDVESLTIRGGTWGLNAYGVFRQSPGGVLTGVLFEGMRAKGCNRAFQVLTPIGCVWRDMAFRDLTTYGLLFLSYGGPMYSNLIHNCKFERISSIPVYFSNAGQPHEKRSTSITDCWFQNNGVSGVTGIHAIKVKGPALGLSIERCYFERNSSTHEADIHLESVDYDGTTHPVHGVVIQGCMFGDPEVYQDYRIRSVGAASLIAKDNYSKNADDGTEHTHFAGCDGDDGMPVWLHRNLIHYIGKVGHPAGAADATFAGKQDANSGVEVEDHTASIY